MKSGRLIIIVAVILILVLSGVIILQHSRLSSAAQKDAAAKTHTAELQSKIQSLEQEVAKLKETADYYYKQGVDLQSAGNLPDAKKTFEVVIAKFPTSNLVGSARQRLTAVNEAIVKAEAERAAEMQRQQEEAAIPEVTPDQLASDFFRNSGNFSRQYLGKKIRIKGKLDGVGDFYVSFAGDFLLYPPYGRATWWFDVSDLSGLAAFNTGDYVTVVCVWNGEKRSSGKGFLLRGLEIHK